MSQHDLTDPPEGSAAADALMAVFGLKRVKTERDWAEPEQTTEPHTPKCGPGYEDAQR